MWRGGGGRLSTSCPSLTSVKDDWGSFSPKMCTNTLRGIAQQDHNRVELVIKYSGPVTNKGFTTLLINGSKKWCLKAEPEIRALVKLTIVNRRDKLLLLQILCQKETLVRWGKSQEDQEQGQAAQLIAQVHPAPGAQGSDQETPPEEVGPDQCLELRS